MRICTWINSWQHSIKDRYLISITAIQSWRQNSHDMQWWPLGWHHGRSPIEVLRGLQSLVATVVTNLWRFASSMHHSFSLQELTLLSISKLKAPPCPPAKLKLSLSCTHRLYAALWWQHQFLGFHQRIKSPMNCCPSHQWQQGYLQNKPLRDRTWRSQSPSHPGRMISWDTAQSTTFGIQVNVALDTPANLERIPNLRRETRKVGGQDGEWRS